MSDSDIDEELLALAGGESEAEDDVRAEAQTSKSPSQPSSPARATTENPPQSPVRRGVAQKKMTRKGAGARRRRKDESEEEGEASSAPSSPNSLGSGAMSESESDTSPGDAGEEDVLFPLEGQFYSEKDKAEIMAMPEVQREELLAERAEEAARRTQDLQLRRLLQARGKEEAKAADKKKRKAGAADLDESQRKSSRPKTKASESLETYKRQREQRNQQRRRETDHKNRDRRSRSRDSDRSDKDAEGESEVEWDEGGKAIPGTREEQPVELRDIERVRVGRSNFAKVCFYPGFEDAITGCFCRISIGVDRATGHNQYRMALVKGFAEGKPYPMEGPNRKTFMTDQYVVAAHGKAEKEWPFLVCSDSQFTEAEFERYKKTLVHDNVRTTPKSILTTKLQGIHDLLNRQWTEEEIEQKIKRQNKYADQNKTVFTSSNASTPKPFKGSTQQERLALLNKANRKANAEEIRKAEIAEKRAQAVARAAAAARAREQEAAAKASLQVPGKSTIDDLFGDGSDISRTGTPVDGAKSAATPRAKSPPGQKVEKKSAIPTFKKRNMDDDLIGAMDLGIEIDI